MSAGPATMRAAVVDAFGGPGLIHVTDLPVPAPAAGEVLVRVQAVAVNRVDTFVRSGAYPVPPDFPFVIGRDLVGTVEVLGDGVTDFAVGKRVWTHSLGHGGRQGATSELAVVAAERLYPLPAGVDPLDAVSLLHPVATAHLALFEHGALRPGGTLVVGGGAGNVGAAAVQLAHEAGARVVATCQPADADRVRSLGADVALDYHRLDAEALAAAAPDGVDLWLDTSGHNDLALAVPALAHRGRVVVIAGMTSEPTVPLGALYTRDGSIVGFAISNATVAELAATARATNRLLADGALVAPPRRVLGLADARAAHQRLEDDAAHGERLVLDLTDTE